MEGIGRYDGSMHMFVEEERSPDMRRLRFLRWLVEHDRYDRPSMGPATGEFVDTTADEVTPSVDPQSMDAQP
jgi:hypothetical protein